MYKFYAYLIVSALGIVATLLFANQPAVLTNVWFIFFVATVAITFTLLSKKEEEELNPIETPVYYAQRKSSFNYENYARSLLLVVMGIAYINSPVQWWPLLLTAGWIIGIITVAIPLRKYDLQDNWTYIEEGLYQSFRNVLNKSQILVITQKLKTLEINAMPADAFDNVTLTPEVKNQFIQIYIKLRRETA